MEIAAILKIIGYGITVLDIFAGALPDKYVKWHSFILRAAKKTHEFGIDETRIK